MSSHTAAGSYISVSTADPATFNVAGYAALAFTDIGEVDNIGEFGREYNLVTRNPLRSRGTVKMKGSYNEGQLPLQIALDNNDAGQVVMKAASLSDDLHSFRITDGQTGEIYYFQGLVMTWKRNYGGTDDVVNVACTIEINTDSATGTGVVEDL